MKETTRFIYLVAAYNEAAILHRLVSRLVPFLERFPGSLVYLLDNGSTDHTWDVMTQCAQSHPARVLAYHDDGKGMGVAYRRGLTEVLVRTFEPPLSSSDWIVLTAADLPFGFSDVDSVLALEPSDRIRYPLIVGSKAHPLSVARRDIKRRLGSFLFWMLRRAILGLKTRDTQGSLFIRGDLASRFAPLRSHDFFVAVEIVDRAERLGSVREVPVTLESELRSSRVRWGADGWRLFRQLVRHRRLRAARERDVPAVP